MQTAHVSYTTYGLSVRLWYTELMWCDYIISLDLEEDGR